MTTLGTRYPTLAFISGGVGEAEDGIPPQPFETFCYDSALMQAKIENFNIIPYTSVLPKELYNNIVPVDSVASSFKHGAVLEVIMAANGARLEEHRAIATGLGLLISTFMKSQIAAIFGTAIITLIPATQFSGMIDPVASLEGPGRWIGEIYPTSHFLTIARGTFSKALDLTDLWPLFIPLAVAIPVVIGLSVLLLKKQEG